MKAKALASFLIASVAMSAAIPAAALAQETPSFATGFADVVERVQPSVVSIRVAAVPAQPPVAVLPKEHPYHQFFEDLRKNPPKASTRGESQGSGFLISGDGYVVTNNHVVEKARNVQVILKDKRELRGRVVGTDPKTDLALIKIESKDQFRFVEFATKRPRVGEWVVAVGNPFGLGGTVTAGIVSGMDRDVGAGPYDDFIQVDAPINKGNSGGPTFNFEGKVVGVNAAIFSPTGGSVGIGFAIPADVATKVIAELKAGRSVPRGLIGIRIQDVSAEIAEALGLPGKGGAIVSGLSAGGAGEKAGLSVADVVLKVDGVVVEDSRTLSRRIAGTAPGTTVNLTVLSKGIQRDIPVKLGEAPVNGMAAEPDNSAAGAWLPDLGLALMPASKAKEGTKGAVVTAVEQHSPAAKAGISPGDVIEAVSGLDASDMEAFDKADAGAAEAGRKSLLVQVRKGSEPTFVSIPRKD